MKKYKLADGKIYYSKEPIIEACAECSNNINGIWGLHKHIGTPSCKYYEKEFEKIILEGEGS